MKPNKPIFVPIGKTFMEGDVMLTPKEIKDPSVCVGCWYAHKSYDKRGREKGRNYTHSCFVHNHACTSGNRRDKKQVVFIEVKPNND